MKALRTAITTYLKTLYPNVYYEEAPSKAPMPYVVFSFNPSFTRSETGETFLLDIDGFDIPANNSSIAVEDMMELLKGDGNLLEDPTGLDRQILVDSEVYATFAFDTRNKVTEKDKKIKHLLHSYATTFYEGSI